MSTYALRCIEDEDIDDYANLGALLCGDEHLNHDVAREIIDFVAIDPDVLLFDSIMRDNAKQLSYAIKLDVSCNYASIILGAAIANSFNCVKQIIADRGEAECKCVLYVMSLTLSETYERLVEDGVDPSGVDEISPLDIARHGHVGLIKHVLNHRAAIGKRDALYDHKLFVTAYYHNQFDVVRYLVNSRTVWDLLSAAIMSGMYFDPSTKYLLSRQNTMMYDDGDNSEVHGC